jgi:hypothetical protein
MIVQAVAKGQPVIGFTNYTILDPFGRRRSLAEFINCIFERHVRNFGIAPGHNETMLCQLLNRSPRLSFVDGRGFHFVMVSKSNFSI